MISESWASVILQASITVVRGLVLPSNGHGSRRMAIVYKHPGIGVSTFIALMTRKQMSVMCIEGYKIS